MRRQLPLILVQFLLGSSVPAFATANEAVAIMLVDGSKIEGQLTDWQASGIKLKSDSGVIEVDSQQLLRVIWNRSQRNSAQPQTALQLTDGTLLPYEEFEVKSREAVVTTSISTTPLSIPTQLITWVRLMPNAPELSATELEGDTIVIYNKKKDSYDRLDGILGEVTTEKVQFTWDGEQVPVKRTKIAAMAYFHAREKSLPAPLCWLTLHNGARLPVRKLSSDGKQALVRTTADLGLSIPIATIETADYSYGKLVYLSDLKPISERWTPRVNLPSAAELIKSHGLPRRDQSYTGSSLSLVWPHPKTGLIGGDRKTFEKGLALRSRTELRYRIPKAMSRFTATAGIDPETAEEGHVELEFRADSETVWQGSIAGGANPIELNIDLGAARELRILVDYGENLDFGDRLHLVEARLIK